jgi:hypothetical protein
MVQLSEFVLRHKLLVVLFWLAVFALPGRQATLGPTLASNKATG